MTPSATAKISARRSALTPVLAKTGTSGTASLAVWRSLIAKGTPAAGPEMRIASTPRNAAPRARSAMPRVPSALLNSGEMLSKNATSSPPIAVRYPARSPIEGAITPRSLSYTPVSTSRMKLAPVALATARLALASQRMFTPNGTRTDVRSSPMTAAIAAGISGPTTS